MEVTIRSAVPDDAEALLAIYAPYVIGTAISFELEPPSLGEFRRRVEDIGSRYPYLVAEADGVPVGYAYAGEFHEREAYACSAETAIYLRRDLRGNGVGRRLYQALETSCARRGITNLYACIAYVEPEDEHLTQTSVRFHERMGYHLAGRFNRCARKFGRWYDMVYMEKLIAAREGQVPLMDRGGGSARPSGGGHVH